MVNQTMDDAFNDCAENKISKDRSHLTVLMLFFAVAMMPRR
ncbi:MAG: hypothetical protein PVF28_02740 [Thioalkalispiraceae bacterium]